MKKKKVLFSKLKKFFDEEIGILSIINMYKIQYKVADEWHSMPLKPEVWNKLMENFTLKNFIFDMNDKPPEYFYEKGNMELPNWSLFIALKFNKYDKYDSYNDIDGSFFRYLTKDCKRK